MGTIYSTYSNNSSIGGADMDNVLMIERLKRVGLSFESGLSDQEIAKIESAFGFRFPKEVSSFLSSGYPVGNRFFNYRDISQRNVDRFNDFQRKIIKSFEFDIVNNFSSLHAMLKEHLGEFSDKELFKRAVFENLKNSPRLIPFCGHRCFFDGMDDMPIISFWQAVDTIIYGYDLENYLEAEFLKPINKMISDDICDKISEKLKGCGIWYYIIE